VQRFVFVLFFFPFPRGQANVARRTGGETVAAARRYEKLVSCPIISTTINQPFSLLLGCCTFISSGSTAIGRRDSFTTRMNNIHDPACTRYARTYAITFRVRISKEKKKSRLRKITLKNDHFFLWFRSTNFTRLGSVRTADKRTYAAMCAYTISRFVV